ncbi:hypothetical protein PVAP13_5KG302800 [Panicum virgatum]|uniref:Uncharacterized protein n=1 Tax=Panicum virgatum TaxID=38727 RepID=A0A8T0SFN7_PANVG|nr:hypothetical protein PVAP13_5KG302800 [Panicum virgatum]
MLQRPPPITRHRPPPQPLHHRSSLFLISSILSHPPRLSSPALASPSPRLPSPSLAAQAPASSSPPFPSLAVRGPAWRGGAAGLARRAGGGGAEPRHGGAPGQLADAGAVQAPGLADLLPHRAPCPRGRKQPAVDAVAPSLLSDASDAPFKATNKRRTMERVKLK